ncbi:hypothetical protein MGP47_004443 [Salmonella enterica]|nr:hypothetical protein [Salmonella enterica]
MDNEHFYHGRPCKRCGGTARNIKSGGCVSCAAKRKGGVKLPLIATGETYHGKPCKHCGTTEKYKSNRACKHCTAEKRKILAIKRKELSVTLPPRERGTERCLSCGETKNYFFLDYCRECVAAEKHRVPGLDRTINRCDNCGVWKPYIFKGVCRQCVAAEKRRRIFWAVEDKIKELEQRQRRYNDPY